jgi:hypothetical protein
VRPRHGRRPVFLNALVAYVNNTDADNDDDNSPGKAWIQHWQMRRCWTGSILTMPGIAQNRRVAYTFLSLSVPLYFSLSLSLILLPPERNSASNERSICKQQNAVVERERERERERKRDDSHEKPEQGKK